MGLEVGGPRMDVIVSSSGWLSGVLESPERRLAELPQDGVEIRQRLVAGIAALRTPDLGLRQLGDVAERIHFEHPTHLRHVALSERDETAVVEGFEDLADRCIVAHGDKLFLGHALRLRATQRTAQRRLGHIPDPPWLVAVDDPEDLVAIAVARGGVGSASLLDHLVDEEQRVRLVAFLDDDNLPCGAVRHR